MNRYGPRLQSTLIALTLLACLILIGVLVSRSGTEGSYFYPLDDTYINMAIAKSLATQGVWGISGRFASVSSCPGFILLLAGCYLATGSTTWWPLALAIAGSVLSVLAVAKLLRSAPPRIQIIGCVLVTLLSPLHAMALVGMEHSIQIALSLLFLGAIAPAIAKGTAVGAGSLILASLMVSVRYEGLFLAAGACLLLLIQKRWRDFAMLVVASWIPVIAFGLYFRAHGGECLPNSLLLKGGFTVSKLQHTLTENALYFIPVLALATLLTSRYLLRPNSPARAIICVATIAAWLHLFLGNFGWVYRYEAYLIAAIVSGVALLAAESSFEAALGRASGFAAICLGILAAHAIIATATLPGRSRVIYSQQYQTARLAAMIGSPIALNDLGSPSFFTGVPIVDLSGLGTQAVMDAKLKRQFSTEFMRTLLRTRGIVVLAVYDEWFGPRPQYPWCGPPLPPDFIRVGQLHTPDPRGYAGGDTVAYYASPESLVRVRSALEALKPTIPAYDTLTVF